MKPIETVGVVGRGALGVSFAHLLTQALGPERVLVLADRERVRRYEGEALLYNGRPCPLHYVDTTAAPPVDLLLFSTKFGALRQAAESCRRVVTPETTLLSVLNGISSEEVLGELFSPEQIVWCVAHKMSAKKEGSVVTVEPVGELAIGVPEGYDACHLRRLTAFFDGIGFPYSLPPDIRLHMWSKLLCNTGCNQAAMVYRCGYGAMQIPGEVRDTMLGAMREVAAVAQARGIPLTEADVAAWSAVIDSLPAHGEPSMRQDAKARRKSEVELFSGTVRHLGRESGVPTPVNDRLYREILAMEQAY